MLCARTICTRTQQFHLTTPYVSIACRQHNIGRTSTPTQIYTHAKKNVNIIPFTRMSMESTGNHHINHHTNYRRLSKLKKQKPQEWHEITHRKEVVHQLLKNIYPYVELMRLHRPIGISLLYWPGACSIALSANAGCFPDFTMLTLFAAGAIVMRSAGCIINDLWDKDTDAKVKRTRTRPLANGSILLFDAIVFLSAQLSLGLLVLIQLNLKSILLGASSLGLVVIYPLMKRVTYWPQLTLGMAFNWGALLGWCATQSTVNWSACMPLYVSGICWTIVYDTIYAHQDKLDDLKIGIKSTALYFGEHTKLWLITFSAAMLTGLVLTGTSCNQTLPYYVAVSMIGGHLTYQILFLNINSPADCGKKFNSNQWVGLILFLGIVSGTLMKKTESKITDSDTNLEPPFVHTQLTKADLI